MKSRVLVLGAGFAGLELSSLLSEELGSAAGVTLIDESDAFVFGFSKLDVMFGREEPARVRLPYAKFQKPGVTFLRESITAIDPAARRVTTNAGVHEGDFLVVALGANYDFAATPGLVAGQNEFYSTGGAEHLSRVLPAFKGGNVVVGVCGAPFKCPPAPSECVLMLHDYLVERGIRDASSLTLVIPFGKPVPPSPETSDFLLGLFAERGIAFVAQRRVASLDAARKVIVLDDGSERPCDLFLGVPKHRVPDVVLASGLAEGDFIAVNPRTLETRFPGVYAAGDAANTGVPKAGVFAEGAARAVAASIVASVRSGESGAFDGKGTCYFEFGEGKVAKVDVDFLSGPTPTGRFTAPSVELVAEKKNFGATRRARWFGIRE